MIDNAIMRHDTTAPRTLRVEIIAASLHLVAFYCILIASCCVLLHSYCVVLRRAPDGIMIITHHKDITIDVTIDNKSTFNR